MQCGARCFIVEFETNGQLKSKRIIARTPAKARKVIRKQIDKELKIISVKKE